MRHRFFDRLETTNADEAMVDGILHERHLLVTLHDARGDTMALYFTGRAIVGCHGPSL